ncbi:hypothetical protein Taro_023322 [Colocasia esculenta]|uniref:Fe2OG dioxygenase domain-containing protein n=1 Tax=Colocasia esculenta TaxID=4460 RepID=A0A843VE66_COLES|nr:hypothetical protein [Colocasia esculenta]
MEMELVVKGGRDEETLEKYMKGVRHLCDSGLTRVPAKYILPATERPYAQGPPSNPSDLKIKLPVVDLADIHTPNRAHVLASLAEACQEHGFFQVVNHGIPAEVIEKMIDVSRRFFELPFEERSTYMSADIVAPVRYGTSFNQNRDGVFCWRDFLKLSCHPLSRTLPLWPTSPADLRERAVSYSKHIKGLFMELMEAVLETLEVDTGPVMEEFGEGIQMMVVNFYPACPEPDLTLGMPPHSDFGFLTLLLQDGVSGLQIEQKGEWVTADLAAGALVVNVGDHLEIFSNGRYKSLLHRVTVNTAQPRMSVACLLGLAADGVVRPSPQLVDDDNPRRYMDTDFATFLQYVSSRETKGKNFLESRMLRS